MKTSMYDNRQNVFELQTALRGLWAMAGTDTMINPDGNFGFETKKAVENAQRYFGVPVTGAADYETWTLLFEEYFRFANSLL